MRPTSTIVNETRGTVVCERTAMANNPWRRLRGLLGRADLPAGEGMLFPRTPSIHSAFMRFAFDAVFLDRELRVLRVAPEIPKWRARAVKHAWAVLELSAGEAERRGVQVGDKLAVTGGEDSDPQDAGPTN